MFQVDYNEVIQELLTYMRNSSEKSDKEKKKKSNFPYFKGGQLILYLHSKCFFPTLAMYEQFKLFDLFG